MAVVQLASAADVVAAFGRDLTADETARVGAILDKASELFRLASGQQFTSGTSEVRLKVTRGQVVLPQRPVVSVESVTEDETDGAVVSFDLFQSRLTLTDGYSRRMVRVAYTHGGVVPELVRLTIAELAKKVLSIDPKAAAGITSSMEVTGPFTDQDAYAAWAVGAQTMLGPSDEAVARSYRLRLPSTIVLSA